MGSPPVASRQRAVSSGLSVRVVIVWFALFSAVTVITIRLLLGTAVWFAQAVDVISTPLILAAALLAIGLPALGEVPMRLIEWLGTKQVPFFVVSAGVFVALMAGTWIILGTTPIAADELVPIFQARQFASLHLVAHYDPLLLDAVIPPVSQGIFVLVSPDGHAISVYFPGLALLLVPFVWLGIPWLLGPLSGAAAVYLIGRLAALLFNRTAGLIAMILAIMSGQFLMTGMTGFPEGVHLTLSLLFAWLMLKNSARDYLFAGLVGGLALALKNPYPHLLFALPWVMWVFVDRGRRRNLVLLFVGYLPGLIVIGAWVLLQGTLTPPQVAAEGGLWLSKLEDLLRPPSLHSISIRAIELLNAWAWSAPGLLLLAVVGWLRTSDIRVRLFGLSFAVTVLGYTLFPDQQGLGYGARYLHAAWGGLPILAAGALSYLGGRDLSRYVLAAGLIGAVLVMPVQFFYGHMLNERRAAPERALDGPGVNLYFVRFHGERGVSETVLADDLSDSGDVFLVSQGSARDQLVVDRWFPGSRLITSNTWGTGYARP